MKLTVSTPEATLFDGEVSLIQLPGIDGKFEILDHHAPLISMIAKGNIRIVDTLQKETSLSVERGILEIKENRAALLVL